MLGKFDSRGEGDDRGWDGWMVSPTQWTWVWASSGRWWWTGKPGVLQSVGLQRVGHNWATENHQVMGRAGIHWEISTDIYTLLYTKEITNKNMLCSTGNSTQYSVMAYMGKNLKQSRYRYVYNWITLLYTWNYHTL